jgi:phosphotransferase system enzyme I (PtsI)
MLRGIGVSREIVIGNVFVLDDKTPHPVDQPQCRGTVEEEKVKLQKALKESKRQIQDILLRVDEKTQEILTTQLDFLDDPAFNGDAIALVQQEGMSAAEAIQRQTRELFEMFNSMEDDPYMKERAADIADAGNRIANNITGISTDLPPVLPPNTIVAARDLVPSQTAQLDLAHVLGFVTETGGQTSHTAIMARSLGLAAVVGCPGLMTQVRNGQSIIVNAPAGEVLLNPGNTELEYYQKLAEEQRLVRESEDQVKNQRILNSQGRQIFVTANIGAASEAKTAKERGADGIGLFRTEFLYMGRETVPTEDEQFAAYRDVAEIFGNSPVIIRTLDIGGDKMLPYLPMAAEENPALGLRAIRLSLKNPELFTIQLRAILRASVYGNLKILFPMISSIEELSAAKNLLKQTMDDLKTTGVSFREDTMVGMMIETPAAAVLAAEFVRWVDFFSIGTNDLTQYTLAVDRGNLEVNSLYNSKHPAVLRLIQEVIAAAHQAGIGCYMCGELAGSSEAIPQLAQWGLDEFSVSLDAIASTKAVLLGVESFHPANTDVAIHRGDMGVRQLEIREKVDHPPRLD